jgi:hypothetical protein
MAGAPPDIRAGCVVATGEELNLHPKRTDDMNAAFTSYEGDCRASEAVTGVRRRLRGTTGIAAVRRQ